MHNIKSFIREIERDLEREREMEGIREIARSYYERASNDGKSSVKEYFKKLDADGDGKISRVEFKESVHSWFSGKDDTFELLDRNGDDTLDFDDVVCLYYMEKKMIIGIARCDGCEDLLLGPFFSCLLCFEKGKNRYDLCCSCYRRQDLSHDHSSNYLLDHLSLLYVVKNRTTAAEETKAKDEMEELHEIAKAHYGAGSPKVQALAMEFFKSMDTDGDGRVNLTEFLTFMTQQQGYSHMRNRYFFNELDRDGNGTLDFSEVMMVYYIIKSGRPFCGCCAKFIPGIFFSCVECFKNPQTSSFDLCRDCYRSVNCDHNHDGRAQFLDNYTLLRAQKDCDLVQLSGVSNSNQARTTSNATVPLQRGDMYRQNAAPTYSATYNTTNYTTAIVPASKMSKLNAALHAFEAALHIGTSIAGNLCTIL